MKKRLWCKTRLCRGADNIVNIVKLFNDFTHLELSDVMGHESPNQFVSVFVNDVREAITLINRSSSLGHGGLSPQHVVHTHPTVIYVMFKSLVDTR